MSKSGIGIVIIVLATLISSVALGRGAAEAEVMAEGATVAVTLAVILGEAISGEAISENTEAARESLSRAAAFTAITSATTAA